MPFTRPNVQEYTYFLPLPTLRTVLTSERKDLAIAVYVNMATHMLEILLSGNTVIVAPFASFQPCGTGLRPDFTQAKLIDYGQTLALGKYESAIEAIIERNGIQEK